VAAREQDADLRAHADEFGGGQGWYLQAGVGALPCRFFRRVMPGTVLERAFYRARAWGLMPKLGIIFLTRRRLLAGWSEYEVLMKTPLRVSMFWRIPTARHAEPGRSVANGEVAHG
jgi:hypothetical protein